MQLVISTEDDSSKTPTTQIVPLRQTVATRVLGGRYQVRRLLGRGGMSDVYLGDDLLLQRAVAIKILHHDLAEDSSGLERFRLEATALAALRSPHVVGIHDIGVEPDGVYLVMEHIDGNTLDQEIVRGGVMPQARAESVLLQVLAGLAAMHARGLVHRDIKPTNVLLDEDDHVVLVDLGIVFDTRRARMITPPGMVPGTPGFIAPESRLRFETELSSDVYQVGLLVLFLLTGVDFGRRPLATTFDDLFARLPPALAAVARRALADEPVERFASAMAMKEAVEAAIACPPPDARGPRRDDRRTAEMSAIHLLSLLADASPTSSSPPRDNGGLKTAELEAAQILLARPNAKLVRRPRVRMETLRRMESMVRGRVLVVDDDPACAGTLCRLLASEHDCIIANSVGDAVDKLAAGDRFDVIVCDLEPPLDLHAALSAAYPHQADAIIFVMRNAPVGGVRADLSGLRNQRIGAPFDITMLKRMIHDQLAPNRQVTVSR